MFSSKISYSARSFTKRGIEMNDSALASSNFPLLANYFERFFAIEITILRELIFESAPNALEIVFVIAQLPRHWRVRRTGSRFLRAVD